MAPSYVMNSVTNSNLFVPVVDLFIESAANFAMNAVLTDG
jgi:hypothetical protein